MEKKIKNEKELIKKLDQENKELKKKDPTAVNPKPKKEN